MMLYHSPTNQVKKSVKSSDTSEGKKIRIISEVIAGVNKGISFVGLSPIKMRKIHQTKYCKEKIDSISNAIKTTFFTYLMKAPIIKMMKKHVC